MVFLPIGNSLGHISIAKFQQRAFRKVKFAFLNFTIFFKLLDKLVLFANIKREFIIETSDSHNKYSPHEEIYK